MSDMGRINIKEIEAERDKLRKEKAELVDALELADAALSGVNMNMNVVQRKITAAINKAIRSEVDQ